MHVKTASAAQLKTVGFGLVLIGAGGHNGLSPSLSTGLVLTGAEEQPVAVLRVNALKELTQGLVAALSVAAVLRLRLRGLLALGLRTGAGGDVVGALTLAVFIQVAGFGGVQTGVAWAAGI